MSTEITAAGTAAATFAFGHDLIRETTVTIASSGTTSGAADLGGTTLVGLRMPDTLTGTSVTFKCGDSLAGTYQTLQRNGADYSVPVAASKYISLDPNIFAGVRFIKVVSGSSEGDARSVILVSRPV